MVSVSVLPSGLNRSRSSSNAAAAPSSRERSATLASSNSTHLSVGTMSTTTATTMTPSSSEASAAFGSQQQQQQQQQQQPGPPPPPPPVPMQPPQGASSSSASATAAAAAAAAATPATAATAAAMMMMGQPSVYSPPSGAAAAAAAAVVAARKEPPRPLDMGDVLKYNGGTTRGVPTTGKESGQNPDSIYQTIQEASAKRISSLDYLKKTHEPRVFWFNTLLYTQPDIARLPSFSAPRMSRRATNFLLLGVSLPSVIDLNTQSPTDYLKALNALLTEFEDYEKQHPADGSTGSLRGPRIGTIFRKGTYSGGKRRTSSAADIGLPVQSSDPAELRNLIAQNGPPGGSGSGSGGLGAAGGATTTAAGGGVGGVVGLSLNGSGGSGGMVPSATSEVIPTGGELAAGGDFNWLRTPSVPMEPDFFEVFVTLCDMLIECYSRIASLVSSPSVCAAETGDIFSKADGRIRKVVFEGIIKEFVEHTRAGVRNEIGGIGKIILGGLM